jgi:hypothetical protein
MNLAVVPKPRATLVVALQFVPVVLIENRCRDATELSSTQLRTVVALIAARRVGRLGATCQELQDVTGVRTNMTLLARAGWIVAVARIEGSNESVWAPTPRAAPRQELAGWQVLLFSEEELERVDPNEPGFLKSGPGVVDTTGESIEGERAAS